MFNLDNLEEENLAIVNYTLSAMRAKNFTELEMHKYIDEAYKSNTKKLIKISNKIIDECNKRGRL